MRYRVFSVYIRRQHFTSREEMTPFGACPECGAAAMNGRTCQDRLHSFLEKKSLTDAAAYGLAVACYTLQHPGWQSDTSLKWAYFHVIEAVQTELPLAEIRQRVRTRFDQNHHHPSVEALRRLLANRSWRMNINELDVIQAKTDTERILIWATLVMRDMSAEA
jgi:hypothetical protein